MSEDRARLGLGTAAKKARLVRGFFGRQPIHCTWQLSPRCESFCHFCEHRADGEADGLDTQGCIEVAERLGDIGTLLVSFTGSDPFLRGDLPEIVAAVARRHFPLLVTNGWLVTPSIARSVWESGLEVATVTVSHADPARHDAESGQPGSHERALAAVATLAGERTRGAQKVNVRTRLAGPDTTHLPALMELAKGLGADVVVEAGYPLPVKGEGGAVGLGERLRAIRARHGNLRTGGIAIGRMEEALEGGVPGCQAGRFFFNVDHRGRLSKCLEFQRSEDRVGTLAGDGATAVVARLKDRHEANDCQACWYASRAEIEALYTFRGFFSGLADLVRA
jgi:MoaA/NifB/PqqE/SkfB family radical SAM enzyme